MTKMTMTATAIWNDEKGLWEVSINDTYESDTQFLDGKYHKTESNSTQEIKNTCDEFVFAWASLRHNGINTEEIDKMLK